MEGAVRGLIEDLLTGRVIRSHALSGGFTSSALWSVELDDDRCRFVKVATDDDGVQGNRTEAAVLRLNTSARLPRFEAISDDGSVLITEDLSGCDWEPGVVEPGQLFGAIGAIAALNAPDELFVSFQGSGRNLWANVLADDRWAPAVGVDGAWLDRHGGTLAAASLAADTSGDWLLHGDLGPGNWCRDGIVGWRFVDWASAHRGNPCVDHAIAAVRLTRGLGRPCASAKLREQPEMSALIAGRFANELLDVDWSGAPPQARAHRVADIRAALVLSADLLGLPDPCT